MAAVYAGSSVQLDLPDVINFQPGFDHKEGWIYGLPANYVRQHQQ